MARTPSKRWVEQVNAVCIDGWSGDAWAVSKTDAITLLSRQHAAFVRLVKKMKEDVNGPSVNHEWGYKHACNDLIAALQQGGNK